MHQYLLTSCCLLTCCCVLTCHYLLRALLSLQNPSELVSFVGVRLLVLGSPSHR